MIIPPKLQICKNDYIGPPTSELRIKCMVLLMGSLMPVNFDRPSQVVLLFCSRSLFKGRCSICSEVTRGKACALAIYILILSGKKYLCRATFFSTENAPRWRKLMEKEHGREAVKLALQKPGSKTWFAFPGRPPSQFMRIGHQAFPRTDLCF